MDRLVVDVLESYQTPYYRISRKGDPVSGPSMVEPGESLPVKVMVERMMSAGVRLAASRAEYYDFKDEESVVETASFPERTVGFDRVEADQIAAALEAKHRKAVGEQIAKKKKADSEKEAAVVEARVSKGVQDAIRRTVGSDSKDSLRDVSGTSGGVRA